jgi:hypothetical protein
VLSACAVEVLGHLGPPLAQLQKGLHQPPVLLGGPLSAA